MLGVRIRALGQIAKLYGVDAKAKAREPGLRQVACATPEEVAERAREWLEREGMGGHL